MVFRFLIKVVAFYIHITIIRIGILKNEWPIGIIFSGLARS